MNMPDFTFLGQYQWVAVLAVAIGLGWFYNRKANKEDRLEEEKSDVLEKLLNTEREDHLRTKAELKDAYIKIVQQINDFGKMTQENATLAERMQHMQKEQQRMSDIVERQSATIQEQSSRIETLTKQVQTLTAQLTEARAND